MVASASLGIIGSQASDGTPLRDPAHPIKPSELPCEILIDGQPFGRVFDGGAVFRLGSARQRGEDQNRRGNHE